MSTYPFHYNLLFIHKFNAFQTKLHFPLCIHSQEKGGFKTSAYLYTIPHAMHIQNCINTLNSLFVIVYGCRNATWISYNDAAFLNEDMLFSAGLKGHFKRQNGNPVDKILYPQTENWG